MSVSSNRKNDPEDISVTKVTGEDKVKKYNTLDDVQKNATEVYVTKDKAWISDKQESPKDDAKRINPSVKIVTAKNDAKKNDTSNTMQHLLSDGRTAIPNQQLNTKVRNLSFMDLKSATMHHSLFSGCSFFKHSC